mmetsp:Transcript_26749/g.41620  ORF Transcript_26749/g.41620 Transcript_26749/m.41620 type:complete len:463 (-) Transcript_26749:149-1537(-)
MGKKRAVSAAAASSSAKKLQRQAQKTSALESEIEFQKDLDTVVAKVSKEKTKVKEVLALLKAPAERAFDPKSEFNPDLLAGTIVRTPPKFLCEKFLPSRGFKKELLNAIVRKDRQAPAKILMRSALLTKKQAFGPQSHQEWMDLYGKRCDEMGFQAGALSYDDTFAINWDACGHFTFMPPIPHDVVPADHIYTDIVFRGKPLPIGDVVIRGSWKTEENWDHMNAVVFDPEKKWRKEPCKMWFINYLMSLAPEMQLPGAAPSKVKDTPMLQLEDRSTPVKEKPKEHGEKSPLEDRQTLGKAIPAEHAENSPIKTASPKVIALTPSPRTAKAPVLPGLWVPSLPAGPSKADVIAKVVEKMKESASDSSEASKPSAVVEVAPTATVPASGNAATAESDEGGVSESSIVVEVAHITEDGATKPVGVVLGGGLTESDTEVQSDESFQPKPPSASETNGEATDGAMKE